MRNNAKLVASLFLTTAIPFAHASERKYSVPEFHWKFMTGYKYEYPDCTVAWSERTATFLVSGNGCDKISDEKMRSDAIASINYVKKNSSAHDFSSYYAMLEEIRRIEAGEKRIVTPAPAPVSNSKPNSYSKLAKIWAAGCSDYKKGMKLGDFSKSLNVEGIVDLNITTDRRTVITLYMDGWDSAHGTKGFIDCEATATTKARLFAS